MNKNTKKKIIKLYVDESNFPMLFKLGKDEIGDMCFDIFKKGYDIYFPSDQIIKDSSINRKIDHNNKFILENLNHHTDSVKYDLQKIRSDIKKVDLDDKLDRFTWILEEMLGISNNSSRKGKISEDLIYKMIKTKFKDYTLEETRNVPHFGDAILGIPYGKTAKNKSEKILIEIKNYSKTVDRDEIDKLIYDMKYTNIKYSLFISLKSGFMGRKQMSIQEFKYEGENYTIVYLPNLFGQIDKIEAGVLLIERLMEFNKNRKNSNLDLKWLELNITEHLKELDNIYYDLNQFKQRYYVLEKNIKQNLHDYYMDLRSYEVNTKNRINHIWNSINSDFNDAENIMVEADFIGEQLKRIKKGSKVSKNICMVFEILIKNGFGIDATKNNNLWHILDKNKFITGTLLKETGSVQVVLIEPKISYKIMTNKNIKSELVKFDTMLRDV